MQMERGTGVRDSTALGGWTGCDERLEKTYVKFVLEV